MSRSKNYCVIMAGGIGSRFWPLSTSDRPKQFIDILDTGRTLLQMTYDRFIKLVPEENFLVVTSDKYVDLVKSQLPNLRSEQILAEPLRRNTAPCIAYATYKILCDNNDANIIVAPSDHLILKEEQFLTEIEKGLSFVENNASLLTLGIHPSRPETGYGYIQIAEKANYHDYTNLYRVKTFTEKPDRKMAELFIETGEFYWNSGIFIWSAKSILQAFESHLPEVNALFARGMKLLNTDNERSFINKAYSECPNISIDYGIMEKAQNVFVLCTDIGWSDLGTWGSLYENHQRDSNDNAVAGQNTYLYDTNGCIINMPGKKTVVIQGLQDYIVVESDQALLICRKSDEQQIRQFVADVTLLNGNK